MFTTGNKSESGTIWLKIVHDQLMKTLTKPEELKIIKQLSQFVDGTKAAILQINTIKKEKYNWTTY